MAPPRATKKSSLTTISQTATQQGAQQSRKQVVEEVEQLHEFDNANSMDVDDEIEAEEPQSQSTSDGPLEQLMAKMVDDVCSDGSSVWLSSLHTLRLSLELS
jgi:membrane carboxypeptidase/penicillin-binding protein